MSFHSEVVHRAAPPGEEHPAEHDEPEQVPELAQDQPERPKQFRRFETDQVE